MTDVEGLKLGTPKLNVYPNPAKELLFVAFEDEAKEKIKIDLRDISGKLLSSYELGRNNSVLEVNISSLERGMYQLIFSSDKNYWSKGFMKE